MKLLFDQNLSRSLVGHLRDAFPDSRHATALGLDTATDREIWDYARENGYLIVSEDSDFRQLAFLYGHRRRSCGFGLRTHRPLRSSASSSITWRPSRASLSLRMKHSACFAASDEPWGLGGQLDSSKPHGAGPAR